MKKNKFIAFLTTITVTVVAAFSATVAWFSTTIRFGDDTADVTGYSDGAYYDYGSGTAGDPYGIRTPRHLYNLAWLQYLGFYNKKISDGQGGEKREQFYFELAGDVDMTGWTIPPIGTTTYPFIGEFNGNGYVISNASTSNLFNDYERTPDIVNSVTGVDIIGLFGVVGSLDTGVTDDNKASVPLTDAYGSAPYDSQVNQIIDLGIENTSVYSKTDKTLIGIAAGYVNGTLDGVAVNNSNISISSTTQQAYNTALTENYSDYSLVGYATDHYKGAIEEKEIKVETPEAEYLSAADAGDNWGNSINFLNAYNRLLREKNTVGTDLSVTYVSGSLYDTDGTTVINSTETTVNRHKLNSGFASSFIITQSQVKNSANKQVASYTFYNRTKTESSTNLDNYMYMFGDYQFSLNTSKIQLTEPSSFATGTAYFIHDNDNHYLVADGATIENTTKQNLLNYTGFTYTNRNYLSITSGNYTYYLYVNNGTLSLNRYNQSVWYYDSSNHVLYTTANNRTYYLHYSNNQWVVSELPDYDSVQYIFSFVYNGNTYYLSANGTTIAAKTGIENALKFTYDDNDHFYTIINGQEYFLSATRSGGRTYTYTFGLNLSSTNNLSYISYDGQNMSIYARNGNGIFSGSSTFIVNYNGSFSLVANGGSNDVTFNYEEVQPTIPDDIYEGLHVYYNGVNSMNSDPYLYRSNPTYFPLGFQSNTSSDAGYNEIADNNTGYIVSGANYLTQPGDLRISKYSISDISNSLGNGATSYTYNESQKNCNLNIVTRSAASNGYKLIKDDYNQNNTKVSTALSNQFGSTKYDYKTTLGLAKYADSRENLHKLFSGASNIYGLHFMDSQISTSNKIMIPYAKVNRNEFENYELPEDCVDFNLKRKGYINFFAGTYFNNNKTFFSLHEIQRDSTGTQITAIFEISKIYNNSGLNSKDYPYIYLYSNGNYSIPVTESSDAKLGSLAFDMEWVTSPTVVDDALYYYEIPACAGEYALGSVKNKDGAYLMYLDIGASTNSTDVTTVTERITTITDSFEFVIGIDFVTNMPKIKNENEENEFEAITGHESALVVVPSTATGTLNYTMSVNQTDEKQNTLTLSAGTDSSFSGALASTYSSLNTTIVDNVNSTSIIPNPIEHHEVILDKITSYEYNAATSVMVVGVSRRLTVDGVKGQWADDDADVREGVEATYTSEVSLTNVGDIIFEFEYSAPSTANITVETFYHPETSQYFFTITSDVDITIHITKLVATYNYVDDGGNERSVTYSFYINSEDTTVSQGDYIDIAASS